MYVYSRRRVGPLQRRQYVSTRECFRVDERLLHIARIAHLATMSLELLVASVNLVSYIALAFEGCPCRRGWRRAASCSARRIAYLCFYTEESLSGGRRGSGDVLLKKTLTSGDLLCDSLLALEGRSRRGGRGRHGPRRTRLEPRCSRRGSPEQPRLVVLDLFLSLEYLPVLVPLPLGAQTSGRDRHRLPSIFGISLWA